MQAQEQRTAATTIQKLTRGRLARVLCAALAAERLRLRRLARLLELEEAARLATKCQRWYRNNRAAQEARHPARRRQVLLCFFESQ